MKHKLLSLFTFFMLAFAAHTQMPDPNARILEMGLPQERIDHICEAAAGDVDPEMNWGLPSVLELIFRYERYNYGDSIKLNKKESALTFLRQVWEEKYSCLYCQSTCYVTGSLDMISMYYNNKKWVRAMYNPKGRVRANVNKIRIIAHYPNSNTYGTLTDWFYYITEVSPTNSVAGNTDKWDTMKGLEKEFMRDFGGKHMSDMTPAERSKNQCE